MSSVSTKIKQCSHFQYAQTKCEFVTMRAISELTPLHNSSCTSTAAFGSMMASCTMPHTAAYGGFVDHAPSRLGLHPDIQKRTSINENKIKHWRIRQFVRSTDYVEQGSSRACWVVGKSTHTAIVLQRAPSTTCVLFVDIGVLIFYVDSMQSRRVRCAPTSLSTRAKSKSSIGAKQSS